MAGDDVKQWKTAGDRRGLSFTQTGGASSRKDQTGPQNAIRPSLWFLLVGQL